MAKFSITGEFITERMRDLWQSRDFKQAIKLCLESLDGITIDQAMSIIDGKMMLTGVGDVDLVEDKSGYKPDVSFLDILDYAMIPNSGYFRIYDIDCEKAAKIVKSFDMTAPDTFGDDKRHRLIREWNNLLPEVRNDFKDRITHWMLVYMRKNSPSLDVKKRANFYSMNIIETELDLNPTREQFDKICDKYYIYNDREECWYQANSIRKSLNRPTPEAFEKIIADEFKKYKVDITMKADYGWLSPEGRYYTCEWAAHEVAAEILCSYFKFPFTNEQKIGKQLSDVLLKLGWVKIHRDDIGIFHITNKRKFTIEQELKIDRYKAVHKMKK